MTPAIPVDADADAGGAPGPVRVHLWAAARAAAGTAELDVPAGTLAEVVDSLLRACPALADVLPRCSLLVDEQTAHGDRASTPVDPGSRVDVLPPFAGG